MSTAGFNFLASALESKDLKVWISFGDLEELFLSEGEKEVYGAILDYIGETSELPPPHIIEAKTQQVLKAPGGSVKHYYERLVERHIHHTITNFTSRIAPLLVLGAGYKPKEALKLIEQDLLRLRLKLGGHHAVSDFRNAYDDVWEKYLKQLSADEVEGITLGWPMVDSKSKGLIGGDMGSIVGRPETGKTFLMLYAALHAWKTQKACPAFFTQEMPGQTIKQRMAAMLAGAPLGNLMAASPMPKDEAKLFKSALITLKDMGDAPFWIIDGKMASSVQDVYMHCAALGADIAFIDGAYLLKHHDKRMNRYQRVAENCDLIKEAAIQLDIPIMCSWQFSREQSKKQKKNKDNKPDLEDIGYSDAIGQHSSLVLGLLEQEKINTLTRRKVYIMKGRDGQIGDFEINWNMMTSDFSEKVPVPVSEMQLSHLG